VTYTLTDHAKAVYDWFCDDESREFFLLRKRHTEQELIDTVFLTTTTNVSAEIVYRISNDFLSVKNIHFVSELLFSSGLSGLSNLI
jgi:hypothetical protein